MKEMKPTNDNGLSRLWTAEKANERALFDMWHDTPSIWGWKIIPNTSFLTPSYWKDVCHSDQTFASKEEAIHILEAAGWTMMPMTDGDCIKFQKSAEWSASPDAIDRWNEFWKNNPYAKEE